MDLVDALSSDFHARSVVELCLNPRFRHGYSSLYKAIGAYEPKEAKQNLAHLVAPYIPRPHKRQFYLLGVDVTSLPRPFAYKLDERECVHQPTPVQGNKPIALGHQYSELFFLPEMTDQSSPHRVIPFSAKRVKNDKKAAMGAIQVRELLEDKALPFHDCLCAEVVDCGYSSPAYLSANRDKSNLITITRARSNRVFYRQPEVVSTGKRGHETWYGDKYSLRDPATWNTSDETATATFTSRREKTYQVKIEAWYDMLMRGKYKKARIPMQDYPFTLVRVSQYNEEGELVFANPMWLIVIGEKRRKLSLLEIYEAYKQRYDVEHFFRFGKQRMLLSHFQTPDTRHEEKWWNLVHLAYLQLWMAKEYAVNSPRPWEKYLPTMREGKPSPAMAQRSFDGIICRFGTPASFPKRRGKSSGRRKGMKQVRRDDKPIVRTG